MLPENIEKLVGDKPFTVDSVGLSGSEVRIYDGMVLKIEAYVPAAAERVELLRWAEGKLPVPRVLAFEVGDGHSFLLMSRIGGKMSCDSYYLEHQDEMFRLMAESFRMLWSVDISDCPVTYSLDEEFASLREKIGNGTLSCADEFCAEGFDSPLQLLEWLEEHRPSPDPVFSHGDFCMPNILFDEGKVSGFIDLGNAAVADRWRDIADCIGSLKRNFDGTYGGKVYPDFVPERLFDYLDIEPDHEKLRFYLLLNELY